jgi:hypothetical protein
MVYGENINMTPIKSSQKRITMTEDEIAKLIDTRVTERLSILDKKFPCQENDQISAMLSHMTQMQTILDTNQKRIDQNTEALYGNGKPGLIASVAQLSKDVGVLQGGMDMIMKLFNGDGREEGLLARISSLAKQVTTLQVSMTSFETLLNGDKDSDGLLTKMSKLIEISAGAQKVVWVVAVILITSAVGGLIFLIATHPIPGLTSP